MQVGEPAIATTGLTRRFGEIVAVNDLTLRVPEGGVHGLIGPNGAGKSTTIRLILGLLQPSSGTVTVLGRDPIADGDQVRSRIGAVLEPCGLYERLSAWDNLDYHGRIWRIPAAERYVRAEELLTVFGLWNRRHETVAAWGRGLKQRLCIARSILHQPELLLLDEPFAGLESSASEAIAERLCSLALQSGISIVMATNNLSVADKSCLSVTILDGGRALADGRMDQIRLQGTEPAIEIDGRGFTDDVVALLLRRPEVSSARHVDHHLEVKLAGHVDTAPLVSLLVESGAEISEVRKTKSTLSEAYCALTDDHNLASSTTIVEENVP